MDLIYQTYLERADNELQLAKIILRLSLDKEIQTNTFNLPKERTFFSAVISHCYYSIFYTAKSYLISKEIKIYPPEEHKKAFEEFNNLVEIGIVDVQLLTIYQEMIIKANELVEIFSIEKRKRAKFTYKKLPQANKSPAIKSIEHATTFFRHLHTLLIS
jgi:uncharacterized protein (UPF0332 family)